MTAGSGPGSSLASSAAAPLPAPPLPANSLAGEGLLPGASARGAGVLEYRAAGPRAGRGARAIRIAMLVIAILAAHVAAVLIVHPTVAVTAAQEYLGGGVMGTPFSPLTILNPETGQLLGLHGMSGAEPVQRQYIPRAIGYLALFLVTQWWFLSPRGRWRISAAPTADPPGRRAAIGAGFIGMLLCVGVIATLMELPDGWLRLTTRDVSVGSPQRYGPVWVVMALMWAAWSVVFYLYWRSLDRYTALRRTFRWLLAGTVLEMFLAAPAHAWIVSQRGGECYCQRGTYTGVAFGCTAALWLFGPGALLLFLREKQRRQPLIDPTPGPASR